MNSKYFLFACFFKDLQGKVINEKVLQLSQLTKCTYDYDVTVYTTRGAKSTLRDRYQVHALAVCFSLDDVLNLTSHFLNYRSVFRCYF